MEATNEQLIKPTEQPTEQSTAPQTEQSTAPQIEQLAKSTKLINPTAQLGKYGHKIDSRGFHQFNVDPDVKKKINERYDSQDPYVVSIPSCQHRVFIRFSPNESFGDLSEDHLQTTRGLCLTLPLKGIITVEFFNHVEDLKDVQQWDHGLTILFYKVHDELYRDEESPSGFTSFVRPSLSS